MRSFHLMFFFLFVAPAFCLAQSSTGDAYSANFTYSGPYDSQQVYSAGDQHYLSPVPSLKGSEVYALLCVDAKTSLHEKGYWKGFLDSDGNCVEGDGFRIYMLGNYLNFDQSTGGADE